MTLSVQLYSVREAVAADFATALRRVSDIGYRTVEPYGFVGRAEEYAELLPQFGLVAPTAHAALVGQDSAAAFRAAATIGIATVIDPFIPAERWGDRDSIAATASAINELAVEAADSGLVVGYHNHDWELSSIVDGTPALEIFADLLDDAVVLEVDTYWSAVGGVDPVGLLGRLGARVQAIHVKDGPIDHDNLAQLPAGAGRMPVLDILAAAPQALRVAELDDYSGDMFEALAQSFAYLTANGEEA